MINVQEVTIRHGGRYFKKIKMENTQKEGQSYIGDFVLVRKYMTNNNQIFSQPMLNTLLQWSLPGVPGVFLDVTDTLTNFRSSTAPTPHSPTR